MRTLGAFLMATFMAFPTFAAETTTPAPQDISYLSIEFGEAPLEETIWVEIGINAPSDKALKIDELSIFGEMYTATTNCGDTVDPDKYCVIDLYFTPKTLGEHYGEMYIGTSEGNILLKLYGSGVEAAPE
ncbi:hypothetical protein [Bdellovibrio bacteriovorus]|uniref:hypothetical protein n=1 Tax=Bdellovibrio bacteriovorus TaxID=959 RepID=UPI00045BF46D|nr:hypothetical protein [Bdellovibrio bacteriovorus]AHZ85151.1 hypothetical protein EP01_09400 [Bdellovibrio bacteriovorus]BEV69041.1 hypothetical protein Bb109J_c2461 [Bdellovibrio bacteriovorus]